MRAHLSSLTLSFALLAGSGGAAFAEAPFQSTGFRTGETTHHSVNIWTRTTLRPDSNPADGPAPIFVLENGSRHTPDINTRNKAKRGLDPVAIEYPEGKSFEDIKYGAPGSPGEVRVRYKPEGSNEWQETEWKTTEAASDFVGLFELTGLDSRTRYDVIVDTKSQNGDKGQSLEGAFVTAPAPDEAAPVTFTVSTGQAFVDLDRPDGFQIYPTMLEVTKPDFFVHTGDIVYYDLLAKNLDLARYHWHRTYSLPTNVDFHRQVATYFIKDDHDTLTNDSWKGMPNPKMGIFTWEQGVATFLEQTPIVDRTWRKIRWGQDLEVFIVEGRDFRSPNTMPDGPEKTILGAEQKAWLRESMAKSDTTFKVLLSATPVVGPDRKNKNDNHANEGFQTEGDELRAFLTSLDNTYVVCGDRHWQYHSIHPETGLREYSCGPASDEHAGGWSQSDYREDYHQFLRVKGGYLAVHCDRVDGEPKLTFRFHGVDGEVHFEDVQVE